MRSYMGNTKSADTIVPMALNTTPACQHSSCSDASGRQHPACFALFREKKSPNLSLLQFSSFVMSHFCGAAVAQWPWVLLGLCDTAEWEGTANTDIPSCTRD